MINKPIYHVLFPLGAAATGTREDVRRRRVNSEGEEIRGFGKVRHETAVQDKVDEDEDVHCEDKDEDDDPCARGAWHAARGVLLRFEGCLEVLGLVFVEGGMGVVLRFRELV